MQNIENSLLIGNDVNSTWNTAKLINCLYIYEKFERVKTDESRTMRKDIRNNQNAILVIIFVELIKFLFSFYSRTHGIFEANSTNQK